MLAFEQQVWNRGYGRIAGVDEAGRGPLAGPVCASAVFFDPEFLKKEEHGILSAINDSKQLSESQREHLFEIISTNNNIVVSVDMVDVEDIDKLNILNATHLAMSQALKKIDPPPDFALVDGNPAKGLPCPAEFIVKGDCRSLSIAAASIAAKVSRDRVMRELDKLYPEYGFARHKGYGTKIHLEALKKYGATPHHRRTFKPVREVLDPPWNFK